MDIAVSVLQSHPMIFDISVVPSSCKKVLGSYCPSLCLNAPYVSGSSAHQIDFVPLVGVTFGGGWTVSSLRCRLPGALFVLSSRSSKGCTLYDQATSVRT